MAHPRLDMSLFNNRRRKKMESDELSRGPIFARMKTNGLRSQEVQIPRRTSLTAKLLSGGWMKGLS
jgi:hypothetical protein